MILNKTRRRPTGDSLNKRLIVALIVALTLLSALSRPIVAQAPHLSKSDYDVVEGIFHDGLGTYTEVTLANEIISLAKLRQSPFDVTASRRKMLAAIERLPAAHPNRAILQEQIGHIEAGCKAGAAALLARTGKATLIGVRHVAREYSNARAADLRLEFADRAPQPLSVKTDKSGKIAVTEGQSPDIGPKWADRYFRVSPAELDQMVRELGFASMAELTSHYLNVARLVAHVMIRKLGLEQCQPSDFSRARATDLNAVKHLLRQLLIYKKGSDGSLVIIIDRSTGLVRWESLLEGIDIEGLTADRVSFLPSRPRQGNPIGSEFGIRIDGRTIVSFQIKHKRGSARGKANQYSFSDITTRLRI
jgi:hypothetical protein